MNSQTLNNFIDILRYQYQHILGEPSQTQCSSNAIIERIVSYYEDIISCMPGNVYWLDKHCISQGCNKNVLAMLGLQSVAEFKGLSFEAMGAIGNWSQEAIQSFKNDTLEVIRTGKSKLNIEEPPITHHDGKTIYFLSSRVPLFDSAGNLIGVVGISTDITELKQAQIALKEAKEQAEAASLAKSEFLANMSHDVKTPLSGMIGISEVLSYRLQGEDLQFAQPLLRSGRQLLNFFNHCVEVFKLENGNLALPMEHFNLKTLLNEISDLFQPAIRTKKLGFIIHYPKYHPTFLITSRVGIYRILLNLVSNAVKFTHAGAVTISVDIDPRSQNSTLILIVKDSGIGIAKDKQEVIFEGFTRIVPSYKGIYEGNGIGLFIVQKIVKGMNGTIHIDSETNRGSQFTIQIPVQIPKNQEELLHKSYETLQTTSTAIKIKEKNINFPPLQILLVEDNDTAQLMEKSLLASMNCQIEIADCGEIALEMFEPGKYDLIFMDIGLPGMQGDAVAKLIRKMEQGSFYHVPIIALTAHTTEDISKQYVNAGIQDVISKPLSRNQAKQIIEKYM